MSTTATESIRVPRLGYGKRVRYGVAAAAASITLAAGIAIAVDSDGGTSSGAAPQAQIGSRVGLGFEQPQASSTAAGSAFHHRTGQTLRATQGSSLSTGQVVQRFHHR